MKFIRRWSEWRRQAFERKQQAAKIRRIAEMNVVSLPDTFYPDDDTYFKSDEHERFVDQERRARLRAENFAQQWWDRYESGEGSANIFQRAADAALTFFLIRLAEIRGRVVTADDHEKEVGSLKTELARLQKAMSDSKLAEIPAKHLPFIAPDEEPPADAATA